MSKTLKDLNWSKLVINLLEAFAIGGIIAYYGHFDARGSLGVVGIGVLKCLRDFCTEAKKELEADNAK